MRTSFCTHFPVCKSVCRTFCDLTEKKCILEYDKMKRTALRISSLRLFEFLHEPLGISNSNCPNWENDVYMSETPMKVFWPVLSAKNASRFPWWCICMSYIWMPDIRTNFGCKMCPLTQWWHIRRPHNKLLYEQQRSCVKWLGYWLTSSVNSMVWHALPAKENGIMSSCKVRYWEPVILESRNLSSLHPRVTLSQRENIWLLQPSCNLLIIKLQ